MGRANLRVAAQANLEVASSLRMKLPILWTLGEGWDICLNENCQNGQMDFRGSRGDTQGKSCEIAREALADAMQEGNGWI